MGPLADSTPANAKNRGAEDRRKRRREDNGRGNEEVDAQRTHATPRASRSGSGDDAAEAAGSEIKEIRDAVAEAIQDMERETSHQEIRGEGDGGREETVAKRRTEGRGGSNGADAEITTATARTSATTGR